MQCTLKSSLELQGKLKRGRGKHWNHSEGSATQTRGDRSQLWPHAAARPRQASGLVTPTCSQEQEQRLPHLTPDLLCLPRIANAKPHGLLH